MHHCRIFEVRVFFEESSQLCRVNRFLIVRREQHRLAAVHLRKIRKAFSEYTVVEHEHSVSRLCQRRARRFKSEYALAAKYICRSRRMQKLLQQITRLLVKFAESHIQIRVRGLQTPCHSHVFTDLRRSRRHYLVHIITSSLYFRYFDILYILIKPGTVTARAVPCIKMQLVS